MKSKAKVKKKNAPATFREKCRRAFQHSLKCFDGAQNGNLEEIVASFDLDKKSIDRRIDALEKSRPLAESSAVPYQGNGSLQLCRGLDSHKLDYAPAL